MAYETQKLLRAGRCGTLSRAHDLTTDRPCLIFDLTPTPALEALVQAVRAQSNPRLPRIVDVFKEGATLVVVQDTVDGVPLEAELKAGVSDRRKQTLAAQAWELSRIPHAAGLRLLEVDRLVTTPFGSLRLADYGLDRGVQSEPALNRFLREANLETGPPQDVAPPNGSLVASVLSWCGQVGRVAR